MKRHDESISDRLRRMAATDELAVGRGRAEQIAGRALARVEARPRRRARLAAAIVSGSAFAIVSVTGVGAIADQAVPGDSLYPIDRAYESITRAIGRDVDRTQERLEEAVVLAQRGDQIAAMNHVTTEVGERITVITGAELATDATAADAATPTTQVLTPDDGASPAESAPVDAAVAASAETAPLVEEAPPAVDADESDGDPFVLALENAIRAIQEAAESQDETAVLAADEAVRSVVKLAATRATTTEQVSQAAPGAVTVATTTTTAPQSAVAADATATTTTAPSVPQTSQGNQVVSTTTTVPSDSETDPPGNGETAGDDSGGSQEGSGSAGEPGDGGEESPGPVILPIP